MLILLSSCSTVLVPRSILPSIPGKTVANPEGQKHILDQLEWLSRSSTGKDCALNVLDTNFVAKEFSTDIEHWLVEYCGERIKYKVRITSFKDGRIIYSVTYPRAYE